MADAYTDFLNLVKPEVGASRDAWGDKWNANANAIDANAKAADTLIKDRLPMAAVKTDAQGVKQPWTVAGPVNFADAIAMAGVLGVTGAATFADALSVAKAATFSDALSVAKGIAGGQSLSLTRADAAPFSELNYTGKGRWRGTVDASGNLLTQYGDTPATAAYLTPAGALWLKGINTDVATQIENRAKAFADDRLATARAEYGQAYQKTGGVITGAVDIAFPNAYIDIRNTNSGGVRWRAIGDDTGNLRLRDGATSDDKIYFTTDGDIWMKPYAATLTFVIADRRQDVINRINNKSARLAFIGDTGVAVGGIAEPYSGGVITGLGFNSNGDVNRVRFRQLQMSDSNGSWYACGYTG